MLEEFKVFKFKVDKRNVISHTGIWPGKQGYYPHSCQECHGTFINGELRTQI